MALADLFALILRAIGTTWQPLGPRRLDRIV
jgi:hypothetical protein